MKIYKDSNSIGDWVVIGNVGGQLFCAIDTNKMEALKQCFDKIRWYFDLPDRPMTLGQKIRNIFTW